MSLSIFTKGLILVAVTLVFPLALIGLIAWLQRDYAEAQRVAVQSKEVVNDAETIVRHSLAAESAIRWFVDTGAPEMTESYERAVEDVPGCLNRLRERVEQVPDLRASCRRIAEAADIQLAWLGETGRLMRNGSRDQAVMRVRDPESRKLTDQVRNQVDAFLEDEKLWSGARERALAHARMRLNGLLLLGGIAAFLSTGTIALVFWRGISRRFDALQRNAERLARGQELREPMAGNDEMARIDRTLHQLAKDLARTTADLREAVRQTRDLYDQAPCGYHSIAADGTFVAMNQTELRWLGYDEKDVVGRMKLPDLLTARSRQTFEEQLLLLKERGEVSNVEYELVRKDGATIPVLLNATAIRDAQGDFVSSRATLFDITQRKRAEETIHMYSDIVNNLPIGLTIWRLEDPSDPRSLRLVNANPAVSQLLDVDVRQLLGQMMYQAFPSVSEALMAQYADVVRTGRSHLINEIPYQDARVARNYWSIKAFPLPGRCVAIAIENITGRRQAEREIRRLNNDLERRVHDRTAELAEVNRDLSHKNQENEMFVYSVSHDLRSPLVNLQGFSQELEKGCNELTAILADESLSPHLRGKVQAVLNGKMAKSLGFIKTAVLRLSGIIDALLRLSRAGRVEYRWEPVDVSKLVAEVVGAAAGTIQKKRASVNVEDLPPVWGDGTALEQVFANLIGNALAYLDPVRPGVIEIGFRENHANCPAGFRVYYVRDNGIGIAEPYQHKIFQIFQRAHPGVGEGEGIGLAIVARVVARHRGRVWVESAPGEGSTFFVAFPDRLSDVT